MTTNRTGALDEAFESRIHLKLYYPDLDFAQTMEIWAMNIERLQEVESERATKSHGTIQPLKIAKAAILEFAQEMFWSQTNNRWNGRQIRNAFQVAASLARYEARKEEAVPKMTVKHFRTIHSVTKDFDEFMYETRGKSSAGMAFERGDRAYRVPSTRHDHVGDSNKADVDGYSNSRFSAQRPRPYPGSDNDDGILRRVGGSFNNHQPPGPYLMSGTVEAGDRGRPEVKMFSGRAERGYPSVSPQPRHRPSSSREQNELPHLEVSRVDDEYESYRGYKLRDEEAGRYLDQDDRREHPFLPAQYNIKKSEGNYGQFNRFLSAPGRGKRGRKSESEDEKESRQSIKVKRSRACSRNAEEDSD